jgi:hypothetical protein
MNGNDLISLATQLLAGEGEPRIRAVVSRAYYGAFHCAREFVEQCGVVVPKHDVHDKLSWCLRECREDAPEVAGNGLQLLRSERNVADYDLSDPRFRKKVHAQFQVRLAIEVVDALQACASEPLNSQIRDMVRSYAAGTLRWLVT